MSIKTYVKILYFNVIHNIIIMNVMAELDYILLCYLVIDKDFNIYII